MRKIKLFTLREETGNDNMKELEKEVNEFIKDKFVIDIKFSSAMCKDGDDFHWTQDILVIYDE